MTKSKNPLISVCNFINYYFEQGDFNYKNLNHGVDYIENELNSYLDNSSKIEFLKSKYKEIHSIYTEDDFYDSFFSKKNKGLNGWEYYVEYVFKKHPKFLEEFDKRIGELESNKESYPDKFKAFYDFYSNILDNGYIDIVEIEDLLRSWENYINAKIQLDWIESELMTLKGDKKNKKKKCRNLSELFARVEDYDSIIDKLKQNNLIRELDTQLILLMPESDLKLTSKRFACALGYRLNIKGYFGTDRKDKEIYESINKTFGTNISKTDYNGFKTAIEKGSKKALDYFSPLFFIT